MSRPFCAGSNGQPITIPTGGDLYKQASLISGCFNNPVVECPKNIDNTQNFCFSITDSAPGATAQTVPLTLQTINGIVNPTVATGQAREAKARIEARAAATGNKADANVSCDEDACQSLSQQTNPCNSPAYGTCAQDATCSSYDHPGCNGCCTNPYGAIYQENFASSNINAYCSSSLNPSSTESFCLPCATGLIPITRPCGNDCETITYYTCTDHYVGITLTCNAQRSGTMNYQVTHSNASTEPEVALTTNGTKSGIAYLVPGDTLSVTNLTAQVPEQTYCIGLTSPFPNQESAQFDSFSYTYANVVGNTASISFTGTPCRVELPCSSSKATTACAGSLQVTLTGFTGTPKTSSDGAVQDSSTCKNQKCHYASGTP